MYLFLDKDNHICGYAYNRRLAMVGGRLFAGHEEQESPYPSAVSIVWIPDQPIGWLIDPLTGEIRKKKYPDDVPILPSSDDLQKQIDHETGLKINLEISDPRHAIEEQIGILRDQLVHVLNALGIGPTEEFVRLNKIAIKEIEAARKKKEALDESDTA